VTAVAPRIGAVALLVAIVTSGLFYANALSNPFVVDDDWMVARNPIVRDPSLGNFAKSWTSEYVRGVADTSGVTQSEAPTVGYRPVTTTSYGLNAAISGVTPRSFRIVNVVLHAAAAWLVALWWGRATYPLAGAIAGSMILVHPVATDVVNRIVGRADILVVIGVAGFLVVQHAAEKGRWTWVRTVAAMAFVIVALGAKESGVVVLPLAVMQLVQLGNARASADEPPQRGRSRWRGAIAVALPLVLYIVARAQATGAAVPACRRTAWDLTECPLAGKPLGERGATAAALAWHYLRVFIWPWPLLAMDAPARLPTWFDPVVWLGGSAMICVVAVAGWFTLRRHPVAVALWWWIAGFLVVAQLLFPIGPYREVRLSYPLLPGLACAAALVVAAGFRARWSAARAGAIITTAIALLVSGTTVVLRNRDWRSDLTAIEADVRARPETPIVHLNLGDQYEIANRTGDAEREFVRATEAGPSFHQTWYQLAGFYERHGREADAARAYERAALVAPSLPFAPLGLGILALNSGDLKGAALWLRRAEQLDADDSSVQYNLAVLDSHLGHNDAAIARLERLVETRGDKRAAEALAILRGD